MVSSNSTGRERCALEQFCKDIREQTLRSIASIGIGHVGGCLSIVEILGVLYGKHMNVDPKNPKMEGRDRLVLSKGHAGPTLYATLALKGYFPLEDLLTLNASGTKLPSHCDMEKTVGIDMTTGSLGQGFSCAVGIALGSQIKKDSATIYTIIGDGESQEGQIWEAAMFAAHKNMDNLIAFTDYNKLQIDGSIEEICGLEPLNDKWRSFGWHVIEIDGNDIAAVDQAITEAKAHKGQPTMIIAHTVKGKGVSFVEDKGAGNHNMPFTAEDLEKALVEIRGAQ